MLKDISGDGSARDHRILGGIHGRWMAILGTMLVLLIGQSTVAADAAASRWVDHVFSFPYASKPTTPGLRLMRQDFYDLTFNRSVVGGPLTIGARRFDHGIGTHAVSRIRVESPEPMERFSALVGVDNNPGTQRRFGSVEFIVEDGSRELYRSGIVKGDQEAVSVDVAVGGATTLDLRVTDAGDGTGLDHADWADASILLRDGRRLRLDQMQRISTPYHASDYPFSFTYAAKPSGSLLRSWLRKDVSKSLDCDRLETVTTWTDPASGLRVTWKAIRYSDFPAVEWLLYFENTGTSDTPVISDVRAMDLTIADPINAQLPYRLHKTRGGPADKDDFRVTTVVLDEKHSETMSGEMGRSSNKDLPFFRIDTGHGAMLLAIGWSGLWQSDLVCSDGANLRMTAGLTKTHFLLHPGERVRSPRILVLDWQGDPVESNSQFRRLIHRHYAAKVGGRLPSPVLFCNSCFTDYGLGDTATAQGLMSLIRGYKTLGLDAMVSDAGWMQGSQGGWWRGVGTWTPRKDIFPDGMAPVAATARDCGLKYGLWFEIETAMEGTRLFNDRPELLLDAHVTSIEGRRAKLLNFGLPEARDYAFNSVKALMDLPGFRMYRQDFGLVGPEVFWDANDTPDRVGVTQMKYIEGMYEYWDRLAQAWPDSLREECSAGGRRIDLETVMRMQIHQKSDLWFDYDTDQSSVWGLSQYLPNSCFVAQLNKLDDYSFYSTMASSLCVCWTPDKPGFDFASAKKLVDRYRRVRHLLVGGWYPLLPYSQDQSVWMASQYDRPDLGEGMVVAVRRSESPYNSAQFELHGLRPDAGYSIRFESSGRTIDATGAELMHGLTVTIPRERGTELVVYRRQH